MARQQIPAGYMSETEHPIGGTHPAYPECFRADTDTFKRFRASHGEEDTVCSACPMVSIDKDCDRSCGHGRTWVDAVTWVRLRIWENTK